MAAAVAAGSVAAQTPAAKPASVAPKAPEPIGRMFYTPGQRASLDVARTQRARTNLSTDGTTEETAPQAQTITYSGIVKRSDGKSTVWINGRAINEVDNIDGTSIVGRIRPDGGILLSVPQSGRSVELKPGQSIDLLSGTIEEGYSRKPVAPEPKPAAKPGTEVKPATKAAAERTQDERDRDEQQQKLEAAVRALQDAASKAGAAPPAPPATELAR